MNLIKEALELLSLKIIKGSIKSTLISLLILTAIFFVDIRFIYSYVTYKENYSILLELFNPILLLGLYIWNLVLIYLLDKTFPDDE